MSARLAVTRGKSPHHIETFPQEFMAMYKLAMFASKLCENAKLLRAFEVEEEV